MVALMMAIRAMIITAAAMDTIPAKRQRATNGGHLRPLLRQIATPTVVAIRRHRSMVVPRAQAQTIVNPILRWVVAHPDTGKQYGMSSLRPSPRHWLTSTLSRCTSDSSPAASAAVPPYRSSESGYGPPPPSSGRRF
uniref:Putative splicing factor aedes aegypti splicing factor n=1 Tax=Anopheles darlingi TaxID=43151 RepID=A0A2M4DNY4_ANODA